MKIVGLLLNFLVAFEANQGVTLSRHLLTAIALYPTQQNWKCLHIRNRQYMEFYISNFCSLRSFGTKPRFF